MLPSPSGMGSATLRKSFSKLNHPAHRCPCLRFNCNLAAAAARLRVRMDSLLLSCRALSSPTTCRFIPAHPQRVFELRFTLRHPEGTSGSPWFSIRGDLVYPAHGHPEGTSGSPWFRIRDGKLYPAHGHPGGSGLKANSDCSGKANGFRAIPEWLSQLHAQRNQWVNTRLELPREAQRELDYARLVRLRS
jgi:hypothetical protein